MRKIRLIDGTKRSVKRIRIEGNILLGETVIDGAHLYAFRTRGPTVKGQKVFIAGGDDLRALSLGEKVDLKWAKEVA